MASAQAVKLFVSVEHACGYYTERVAQNVVIDPSADAQRRLYDAAIENGFRRAGGTIYRPHCALCQACIPSRVEVAKFHANRAQRRCLKLNADVSIRRAPAQLTAENFALYTRYLAHRHYGGGMDQPQPEDFQRFLLSNWAHTEFLELRLDTRLLGVAVTDFTQTGLSAVYSFFEPSMAARSLGVLAVLSQIALARELALPYLYLGFWLEGHPKMHYKSTFSALQIRKQGHWQALRTKPPQQAIQGQHNG